MSQTSVPRLFLETVENASASYRAQPDRAGLVEDTIAALHQDIREMTKLWLLIYKCKNGPTLVGKEFQIFGQIIEKYRNLVTECRAQIATMLGRIVPITDSSNGEVQLFVDTPETTNAPQRNITPVAAHSAHL